MDLAQFWNNSGGYQIDQSLRFNSADSTNLTRNISTTGNRRTFTISFWFKSVVSNSDGGFVATDGNILASNYIEFELNSSNKLQFRYSTGNARSTTAVFRDPSAWYHIVFAVDTTQATDTNRIRVYVNGTEYATTGDAYPAQNFDTNFNTAGVAAQIGHSRDNSGNPAKYLSGYIAEYNHIDGQQLTPSSFGETDTITGAWIPKKYSGSYGTNGFYLKFDPAAANGIGHDHSGNGNNWTASGFTTSGTGTDVMSDTPTTNWCTLNPLNASNSFTGKNGNLDFAQSSNDQAVTGTSAITSGKWYWEITKNSSENPEIGVDILNYAQSGRSTASVNHNELAFITNSGTIRNGAGGTETPTGFSSQTGAGTIGIAVDFDNKKIWWSNTSGTWFNSGDPAAGTNAAKDFSALSVANGCIPYVYMGTGASHTCVVNFGQRAFAYTPPTGYKALNTANLPEPTIKDGGQYFDTKLYTGSGGSQSLTGLGFQPELVWIKARSTASSHGLYDAVRGVGKVLQSNSTSAEQNYGSYGVTSFDATGFSVNDLPGYGVNDSGVTYAAWCWDAGGAGSSNNAGTITSTVSANASAGFSIVTYTSPNNSADQTVGHGLGVKPSLIIVKNRDLTYNWDIYHSSLGYNASLIFTTATTRSGAFGAEPTSTVFTTKTGYTHNSTNNYVAYCFSEVASFSKFGIYNGNGSSDGPCVFCGFRPRWILLKSTSSGSWELYDTARDTYNQSEKTLEPNSSAVEGSGYPIDILSNGFKVRTSNSQINYSTYSYIFAAFAELPFKYANAR
jgi:hypothetical protein